MSHAKERKEKDCLNCGTLVHGRYCHVCGQENVEPRESFWHLVSHFFYDITHFDGKFFSTLRYLILKPGFLSQEYLRGRRMSYLNPVKMYVFTSAIFFLLFFSFFYQGDSTTGIAINGHDLAEIEKMDSAAFARFTSTLDRDDHTPNRPMTRREFQQFLDSAGLGKSGIHFTPSGRLTKAGYDSALASGRKKHNWLERQLTYKEISMNEKYHYNTQAMTHAFRESLVHSIPQMLFVSLPLLALLLKLLYIRRRQFYYVNHGIFSLHLYIFIFIDLLAIFSLRKLIHYLHWNWLYWVIGVLSIGLFVYQFKAMRNFYGQGWWKTLIKFLLLNILFLVLLALLFTIFVLFSLFKI